jgi:hypothetical protein
MKKYEKIRSYLTYLKIKTIFFVQYSKTAYDYCLKMMIILKKHLKVYLVKLLLYIIEVTKKYEKNTKHTLKCFPLELSFSSEAHMQSCQLDEESEPFSSRYI